MTTRTLKERRRSIRDRLAELVQRHSQSEIARKTGASRNNVNRYLGGTRLPAEFASALVDELGVNPAWLLSGNGPPLLMDIAESTSRFAGDLLQVVNALNVVSQMRLGSLGGKHHARTLRELGDALARHEDLRRRLNRHSVPILRALLRDLAHALDRKRLDAADELRRTAQQLGRFCDDPNLAVELALLEGRMELQAGNMLRVLDLARKAIILMHPRGGRMGERELEVLAETVTALYAWGYADEAARIARSALALAPPRMRECQAALALVALVADIRILHGGLRRGVRTLMSLRGALKGAPADRAEGVITHALLLSGMIDLAAAKNVGGQSLEKARRMVSFAMLMEDKAGLAQSMEYLRRLAAGRSEPWEEWLPPLMLRALRGDTAGTLALLAELDRKFLGDQPAPFDWWPVIRATACRLVGRGTEARRCFRDSCKVISALPDEQRLGVNWQGRHMRNALALGTTGQAAEAREFFRRQVALGYRCFANLTT